MKRLFEVGTECLNHLDKNVYTQKEKKLKGLAFFERNESK
jgi:hypothetical protein